MKCLNTEHSLVGWTNQDLASVIRLTGPLHHDEVVLAGEECATHYHPVDQSEKGLSQRLRTLMQSRLKICSRERG